MWWSLRTSFLVTWATCDTPHVLRDMPPVTLCGAAGLACIVSPARDTRDEEARDRAGPKGFFLDIQFSVFTRGGYGYSGALILIAGW